MAQHLRSSIISTLFVFDALLVMLPLSLSSSVLLHYTTLLTIKQLLIKHSCDTPTGLNPGARVYRVR